MLVYQGASTKEGSVDISDVNAILEGKKYKAGLELATSTEITKVQGGLTAGDWTLSLPSSFSSLTCKAATDGNDIDSASFSGVSDNTFSATAVVWAPTEQSKPAPEDPVSVVDP